MTEWANSRGLSYVDVFWTPFCGALGDNSRITLSATVDSGMSLPSVLVSLPLWPRQFDFGCLLEFSSAFLNTAFSRKVGSESASDDSLSVSGTYSYVGSKTDSSLDCSLESERLLLNPSLKKQSCEYLLGILCRW